MLIRKATEADAAYIAPLILLAMEEIAYHFIGKHSREKAIGFFVTMISTKANQYSYENCWVTEQEGEIIAAALVYDGAQLHELRKPVAEQIKLMFGTDFNHGDETQSGEYYIDCIGVKPGQQGKGTGSKMLNFLVEEYAKRGTQPLGLLVDKDNPQAKKLYVRSGFEVAGEKIFAGKCMEHMQYNYKSNQ
ncbi:MAG: N-acetyltransferase [Agriterribacter sp.]